MAHVMPFNRHTDRYEEWFEEHANAYTAELRALRLLLPRTGRGLEIGVGSGRFASPLGLRLGVDPSGRMAAIAREKGIQVAIGTGERLPVKSGSLDYILIVTTICFFDDILQALREAARALRQRGSIIIGLIDKTSELGRFYQAHKEENVFYREATFYSVEDVLYVLEEIDFKEFSFAQTLFSALNRIDESEPVREGFGEGAFVVIRGVYNG